MSLPCVMTSWVSVSLGHAMMVLQYIASPFSFCWCLQCCITWKRGYDNNVFTIYMSHRNISCKEMEGGHTHFSVFQTFCVSLACASSKLIG